MTTTPATNGQNQPPIIVPDAWDDKTPQQRKAFVEQTLMLSRETLARAAPAGFHMDGFIKSVSDLLRRTPDLLQCTIGSLMGSILRCVIWGLNPEPMFSECSLQPFNKKVKSRKLANGSWSKEYWIKDCSFQPGYQGLKKLALNTDNFSDIYAVAVYDGHHNEDENNGDYFLETLGTKREIIHRRGSNEGDYKYDDPEWVYKHLTHVYAVAVCKDGTIPFITMTKNKVEARRKRAPSQVDFNTKTPSDKPIAVWYTDYEKMALKTGLRELCGQLAKSTEDQRVQHALGLEQMSELGRLQHNSQILLQQGFDKILPESAMNQILAENQEEDEAEHFDQLNNDQKQSGNNQVNKGTNSTANVLNKLGEKNVADEAQGLNEIFPEGESAKKDEKKNSPKGANFLEFGDYCYKYEGTGESEIVAADDTVQPVYPGDKAIPVLDKTGYFVLGIIEVRESKLSTHKQFKKIAYDKTAK